MSSRTSMRGGKALGDLRPPGRSEAQLVEENVGQLAGRIDVESPAGQGVDLLLQPADLPFELPGHGFEDRRIDPHAQDLHPGQQADQTASRRPRRAGRASARGPCPRAAGRARRPAPRPGRRRGRPARPRPCPSSARSSPCRRSPRTGSWSPAGSGGPVFSRPCLPQLGSRRYDRTIVSRSRPASRTPSRSRTIRSYLMFCPVLRTFGSSRTGLRICRARFLGIWAGAPR